MSERKKQKSRDHRALAKALGRCLYGGGYSCTDPAVPGKTLCPRHLIIQATRTSERKKNAGKVSG